MLISKINELNGFKAYRSNANFFLLKSKISPREIYIKLLKKSTGKLLSLSLDNIPVWNDLGIEKISLSELELLPESISLGKAYPNPFNPTTRLDFSLPHETEISLIIYDISGREVISLINGHIHAGDHSIVWDASQSSSGVYFVKMLANNYSSMQKLLLIK